MPGVVQTAAVEQLVSNINKQYEAVQSLTATVEFQASVGGEQKGKVTDYTTFPGYILLQKPEKLRVIGKVPILHTNLFDLATDGSTFKLVMGPPKNKAIIGSNAVTKKSTNPLENLRPNVFFDSLLIHEIRPEELLSLTSETKTVPDAKQKQLLLQPDYDLNVFEKNGDSNILVTRRVIHISRVDLLPYQEDIYDAEGKIQTQAIYGPYQSFGDFRFPGTITIKRPLEEYQIVITFQKITANQSIPGTNFQLEIPAGTQIQNMQ